MAEVEEDEIGESDARLLYMFQQLSKSLKFKVDKWHRMMASDEYKGMVMEFLIRPDTKRIIFAIATTGVLVPFSQIPAGNKLKCSYFLKKEFVVITAENINDICIFGDLSPIALDQLAILVEDIFLPMLINQNNQTRWPKPVAEDVTKRVLDMRDVVFRVKGEVYGRTLLPLPQGIEKVTEEYEKIMGAKRGNSSLLCDMELRCAIESAVLRWSTQLNEIAKQSSASVFENDPNPVPDAEVKFWSARAKNLAGIYEQLRDPRVKKMALILERTESAYFPCFQKMFKSIVSAMKEAKETDKFLKTIEPFTNELSSVPLTESERIFEPLIHTLCLIGVHCAYFKSSTKIVILLREICNLLIEESNKIIEPRTIFDSEIEETLPKIRNVLQILRNFRNVVISYTEKIPGVYPKNQTPVPWVFDDSMVFERFDQYTKRLELIKYLFEVVMEYAKLEKVVVGGNNAHSLTMRLNDILEQFNMLVSSFSSLSYDPLDINETKFIDDFNSFKRSIIDYDRRLAAVACLAFDDCSNFEQIFKMMSVFGGLLKRPVIRSEIEPKYYKIVTLYKEELGVVQEIFNAKTILFDETGRMDTTPNWWPSVSGILLWVKCMRDRLLSPLESIEQFGHEVTKTELFGGIKVKALKISDELKVFGDQVLSKWREEVPRDIKRYITDSLLKIHQDRTIELNFNKNLVAALKEVRYLKLLEITDLPDAALELYARSEEFHLWIVTLKKITEWYNRMRNRAKPQEFAIVCDEISEIDCLILEIVANNKWGSVGNWEKIKNLHDILCQLTERMNSAQDNLQKIQSLINKWAMTPLYNRAKGKRGELLIYQDVAEVKNRYNGIIQAGCEIYKLIDANFRLLHNLPKKEEPPSSKIELNRSEIENDDDCEGSEVLDEIELTSQGSCGEVQSEAEVEQKPEEEDPGSMNSAKFLESTSGNEKSQKRRESIVQLGGSLPEECEPITLTEQTRKIRIMKKCLSCLQMYPSAETITSKENPPKIVEESSRELREIDVTPSIERPTLSALNMNHLWASERRKLQENVQASLNDLIMPQHPASLKEIHRPEWMINLCGKVLNPEDFASRGDLEEIENCIDRMRKDNKKLENWKQYLELVDSIVEDGLLHSVGSSVGFIVDQMEPFNKNGPLFEIKMRLDDPNITFEPAMVPENLDNSLPSILSCIIEDINAMAALVPRIAYKTKSSSYFDDVTAHDDIKTMENEVLEFCFECIKKTEQFVKPYYKYSYLWMENQQDHLSQFLKYSNVQTLEEFDAEEKPDEEIEAVQEKPPTIEDFRQMIDSYDDLFKEISELKDNHMISSWISIDIQHFKFSILNLCSHWGMLYKQYLIDNIAASLEELDMFIEEAFVGLNKPLIKGDYDGLVNIMGYLLRVKQRLESTDSMFDPIREVMTLLKSYGLDLSDQVYRLLNELPERWLTLKKLSVQVRTMAQPLMQEESNTIRRRLSFFDVRQNLYRAVFRQKSFFCWDCPCPYWEIDETHSEVCQLEEMCEKLADQAALFEVAVPEFKVLKQIRKDTVLVKILWDYILVVRGWIHEWECTKWKKIDAELMDMELKRFAKEIRTLDKDMRGWDLYLKLENIIKNLITALRAITELQNPAIRDRHWKQLMAATKVKFVIDESTTLKDLLDLSLYKYEDEVKTIVDKSVKEMGMEKTLGDFQNIWSNMEFEYEIHSRSKCQVLKVSEEIIETLEENQVQLQNMLSSKFIAHFLDDVSDWQRKLSNADQIIQTWIEVQRTWMYLESIFVGSDDIRRQLPADSQIFDHVDTEFKRMLADIAQVPNVIQATSLPHQQEKLEALQKDLTKCEKALAQYLETKRMAYPRFYFVSSADLLDILSNGNQPVLVCRHLTKLYDSIASLKFNQIDGKDTRTAIGMVAKDGESVKFNLPCECTGQVEKWLNTLTDVMRKSGRHYFKQAVNTYDDKPREQWVFDFPAQASLCGTQIWWAAEVSLAFSKVEEGYENALKDYQKKQIQQLNQLINLLLGELTDGDRQKVTTICTVDVHSRDVVAKLIAMRVETGLAFQWQSQLRHRWDTDLQDCFVNICDAQFSYDYEFLGNCPRLVITPLTDRCYITLTQSLHLIMGGAPAGPAGTGKTETTKDLGKGLGIMVYVFNCSEQMDYKSCGNIYKGLSQTGAWGCFDEFNRISVDVLSVVAVQVKSVLDAIKQRKSKFNFQGELIPLIPSVGMFITMNPGYAGRAELPENLKALFRPCAMVVPDFELICEIMLIGEGFQEARILGKKFLTLYSLCKELLSKQDHYDWGLRAIKSVLVVAGKLKRGDRNRPEDQVLMRALRDFNIPKIVTDDLPIFMGLIGDLFPALDVPRKRDLEFEKQVRSATQDLKLQAEEGFVLKIVQLQELFAVRHSVFIIGYSGTGKSMVWKTLFKTYMNMKKKPYYNDIDPKAVTNDELFGIINPQTREWKDGLFSILMREQANMAGDGPKWMVMDGDIDPMWIESLNTVMDDNKVLTLASNERIALTPSMRLLFEISNLRTATPATVSRAGILYINPTDLGWNPYVTSWIDTRKYENEKVNLTMLFDKYIPPLLESAKHRFKKVTQIPEIAHIQMLCTLLEVLLVTPNIHADCPKDWYEIYFVFSCIWAFGSACFHDQVVDWRMEFSKWWVSEFKSVKFPPEVPQTEQVFNYFVDSETKKFVLWSEKLVRFELEYEVPLQSVLVNTAETTRIRYFLDLLIEKNKAVMLVAPAGCGKSVLINDKLNSLSDKYLVTNISFNFYTTSELLQKVLEKPLEKKAGRNFGPPGNKTMIYFIDDMNMPEVDKYGTVQPHTLIRQHMDYQHWYDRQKLSLKDIHNIMFLSSMNPTSGSFSIHPRLQRHFIVFSMSFPGIESLTHIYSSIIYQHTCNPLNKFPSSVIKITDTIVQLALQTHLRMQQTFLPTAIKFHYIFNLRDLSNIFQAIILTTSDCIPDAGRFIRIWMHEATRVYSDKLVDLKEQDVFNKMLMETIKKVFTDLHENEYLSDPLIYCHFVDGIGDPKYLQVPSWSHLNRVLSDAMSQYNDLIATMNLVLFEDAMAHVCRINRVMEMPRGNALLVGVGGSGKQSLSRLSAFISGLDPFQIQLKKGYSTTDLKIDLAGLYNKAGLKNTGIMFLMTDSQIPDERFLVLINDMLSSGEIPDLLADDEIESIISSIGPETKGSGLADTKENCWKFFIDRVRKNLKTILCFSPVGSTLRKRARKFPSLVNCTTIDWFMEWPPKALENVSHKFLNEMEVLPKTLTEPMSQLMAFVHMSVNKMSQTYLLNERRYNYTTPKSFLELINLYKKLLKQKNDEVSTKICRLQTGLQKLMSCAEQVSSLKVQLAQQEIVVAEKNQNASELIEIVKKETDKVSKEKFIAKEEERKCQIIEEDVTVKQKLCEEDLAKALPALEAAQAALNTLNKTNLTEMKSFGTPPEAVAKVASAVMVLLAKKGKIPKDRSWKTAKAMMGSADAFLNNLVSYNKENIHPEIVKAIQPYITDPEFTPESVITKSSAAAGLCAWVINIMKFHEVWMIVLPKKKAEAAAQAELNQARARLAELTDKINKLEDELAQLTAKFEAAVAEKHACQAEEEKTSQAIDLANRLVNGLASENSRWKETVSELSGKMTTLPGDVVLVTAFISYVGCFTRTYREELMEKQWKPQLTKTKPQIPCTSFIDPMTMLTDDAQIAAWNNEGLPNDRMSAENATILTNSERWPLMIDPQLQGIKWIKFKFGEELRVIRLGQKQSLDKIERAVTDGAVLLIENIGESIDPVLDNLLGRNLTRKGKVLKIGDREIDFHPNFRLILQTKLANPHYQPEIQAQTTLINFTVTKDGLEEQLLAEVVKEERPDLEEIKGSLTKQQNNFKIQLKLLEDELLQRLSTAGPDILSDKELVEKLESTKKTAESVELKVKESKFTSEKIDIAREMYRPVATRASIIYFIMNDLSKINPLYQFSLKAFSTVFQNAISTAKSSEIVKERINLLIDNISLKTFMYTTRGLFECDKLIFVAQLAIQILQRQGEMSQSELDYLLRFPYIPNIISPVDFLTGTLWGGIKALSLMDEFRNLDKDIQGSAKRWKKFTESECPEREKFPQDWKNKSAFQRLCILRSLRPDRMTYAMRHFIEEKLGNQFTNARSIDFESSYEETSSTTPVFFILSPGVDPTQDVERVGRKLGFTADRKNLHNVSLGQGQENVAETALEKGARSGHWVILQNIHLVENWLPVLDKKMEAVQEKPHGKFRLFLSGEPPPEGSPHAIPQGVLESSIKITNEPPTGMMANLHKALDNFSQPTLEMCSKESEFKAILFSLCYFHAVVAERRKFGAQGWNRIYPFNTGDLTISVHVLYNYLENNSKVPWEDLRYLFGEIMYGGHITDDWDRRLCRTYLQEYMCPELVEGELSYAPGFKSPPNADFEGYHKYIDEMLPSESPVLYGLHPNAEIGFLTMQSENVFKTILELQPRDSGSNSGSGVTREEKVKATIDEIQDKIPDEFNIADMMSRIEERTPYVIVAFQECERMNILMKEVKRSLKELSLGLKGELTITSEMEELDTALFMDLVPEIWAVKAYPSLLGLGAWFVDLQLRLKELEAWVTDFTLPATVWLAGFFNPQSFLTAIMQSTARRNEWPLDKMCLHCDVTKKTKEDFTSPPREGAFICNLYLEGARWDVNTGMLAESRLKEMFPVMPVVHIRATTLDKQDTRMMYECPVYKTRMRGPTYVWTFNLKTKEKQAKWILAGVGILLTA